MNPIDMYLDYKLLCYITLALPSHFVFAGGSREGMCVVIEWMDDKSTLEYLWIPWLLYLRKVITIPLLSFRTRLRITLCDVHWQDPRSQAHYHELPMSITMVLSLLSRMLVIQLKRSVDTLGSGSIWWAQCTLWLVLSLTTKLKKVDSKHQRFKWVCVIQRAVW